jgi:2-hydroxy-3-keto-5-methylthiopentenyl-1-phosphate phosphatase
MQKAVFINDFDGTISKEDFFNMALKRFLTLRDLRPRQDYLNKK